MPTKTKLNQAEAHRLPLQPLAKHDVDILTSPSNQIIPSKSVEFDQNLWFLDAAFVLRKWNLMTLDAVGNIAKGINYSVSMVTAFTC